MPHGPGIVDQRRHRPQFLIHPQEQADDFVFIADIGPHADGLRAQCANLLQHFMGRRVVRQIINADFVTLPGSQQRRRCANATAATGDHDDFVHKYAFPIHGVNLRPE